MNLGRNGGFGLTPLWTLGVSAMFALGAECAAAGPLPISGRVQMAPAEGIFSTAFLLDPFSQTYLAGLLDPLGLLHGDTRSALLQTEISPQVEVNGLPLLVVQSVLPPAWAQPAVRGHFAKGPGAYSGFGREYQARNFAGVPLNPDRASQHDNGFARETLELENERTSSPPGLEIREPEFSGPDVVLSWAATPLLHYRLFSGPSVDGDFAVVQEFSAPADGLLRISIPREAGGAFYYLEAVQP